MLPKHTPYRFSFCQKGHFYLAVLALSLLSLASPASAQTVTSATDLESALNFSATPATTSSTLVFAGPISIAGYSAPGYDAGSGFLGAINAPTNGAVLTIDGNGNSLTGGSNALFLASPENEMASGGVANPTAQTVTIENLTISGATSRGGNSSYGGGGAGMGGALFVGTGVNATLNAVNFSGNQAVGGASTGPGSQFAGGGLGGASGENGGGGLYSSPTDIYSGGGANGGHGVFGGSGGFGGGGAYPGGDGGFGGSGSFQAVSGFGAGSAYEHGPAGFGGGAGQYALEVWPASAGVGGGNAGGGGGGFGGAIFVQNGGTLTLTGTDTLAGDTATGGTGATNGAGVGNEIFMMTGSSVTLAPGTGNTLTIGASGDTGDNIADDSASSLPGGQSYLQGTASGAGLVLGSSANPDGTVYLYGNNTYQGGTTLQNGVTLVVGSSNALGTGTITMMDPTMVYLNGDNVSNPIVLMGDTTLEVDNTDSATQSGAISESGGSYGINKTGSGTLTFTAANTYSGATIINSGSLIISGSGASITQTSSVDVGQNNGDNGTLTVTGTGSSLTSTGLITIGDQGAGSLTVENGGSVSTGVNGINNVGLVVDAGTAISSVTVTGLESSLTVDSGTGDVVIGGAGTGSLTISDGGTVTDSSAFLGEGSTAAIAIVDVTGTGSTWTNNGTLTIAEAGTATATIEDNGSLSAPSIIIADQAPAVGTLNIGNNNAVGSLTINSIQFGAGAGTIEFDQTNTATLNADISGAGTVNIDGSGTTILGGNSSYTGTTTISAGTVEVGSATALGASDVVLNGGTLTTIGGGTGIQLNIGGNYTQAAGTTLALNVYGSNNYDSLNLISLGGVATVHGALVLNLAGGFAPGSGEAIAVITTNNPVVGQFSTVTTSLPSIGASANYTDDVTVLFQNPFATLPGLNLTPNQQSVATYIDQNDMTSTNAAFNSVVAALNNLSVDPNALAGAFSQLTPQAFGQFSSTTAFNNASFETEAMDNYLANQRGADGSFMAGNGSIDASGLVVNDPAYDPTLAMVHSRLLAWNPAPATSVISDVANPVVGGIDMHPEADPNSLTPQRSRPWNAFVRGNVVLAQGSSTQGVSHFDDNTESVVLGADYRISPHFLVGLTGSYGHTDATLDNNGSSATVDSYSPGLYASYADKGWYADLSGNYVFNNYTQDRVIGFLGQTAHSAPRGDEGVANLDGGYDFHRGAWTFGPLAGLQYTHLSVNSYNESGSAADLSVNEQNADSLRSRLGGRVSFAFADGGVHFTPHLDVSWQHEFLDQSRGITSQFDNAGVGSFSIQTNKPSRDSALVDLGLAVDLNGTVTAFGDYEVQAGQENYFGQSIQGGVKIGF